MKEKEKLKTALQKLEKIVEDLNKKDIDIEQGLEKFREGVDLIKFCRSQLQKAENEFVQLKQELEQDYQQDQPEPEEESG
ncbi:MAG: exodeoxyribonuclease VII small subunit [Candidatus Omnitrophica bacterium]|nr:exodeoxyribonuclease VII small subunit [Candidatus Omnitrophota bacterium]MCM8788449.1 exodeoxyribonuclease VII small subunit [Candidatus Omnitrophota bacterium]